MRTDATDHVRAGLRDLRDRAAACVEDGQSQAQGLEATMERKIRAQPVTSVAAPFATLSARERYERMT